MEVQVLSPLPTTRPWCNGSIAVSKTASLGSSPRGRAKLPFSIKAIIPDSGSGDICSIQVTATTYLYEQYTGMVEVY